MSMRLRALAAGVALSILAGGQSSAGVVTFDELVADPSVVGSTIVAPTYSYDIGGLNVLLATGATIETVAEAGGTNSYLVAKQIVFEGDYDSPQCCQFRLKSFDIKAASSGDVGTGFRFFMDRTGETFLTQTITLTDQFVRYTFDFDQPITHAGIYFAGPANDFRFAIDNLEVEVVQGIPEPETWALMILGFGSAGVALRRRRQLA